MGNKLSTSQPLKAAGHQPQPTKPALHKIKFHTVCGHHIKLQEGQTKAVWREYKEGRIENVAFTSQPIKLGQTIQISFLKKGYINIGVLHSDPNTVNVVNNAPVFTETLLQRSLCKKLYLMEEGDHIKVCYESIDERQEKVLEGNAKDSAEVWVYFEIVHGDVEVKLKLLQEDKEMTFHSRHGGQIELADKECTAYLKEGFLSVACIVECPLASDKIFQICAPFLHDIHGFVFFRFGILTKPPGEINFNDLSKELRLENLDAEPAEIWFRETLIKSENYKGHFHLRWSKTGMLKHNITEDCSEETVAPQTDPTKQAWLLLELFQMEATVHIEETDPPLPDNRNRQITNSRYLLMTNIETTVNKETLTMLLEVALERKNPVQNVIYGSSSDKVVVIFSEPVNSRYLENLLKKQSHDYKFEAINEPTVVQVFDIPQGDKYLSAVKMYMVNEKDSGGTRVADFYGKPDPNCGFCLIDLKDPEVVRRVCGRTHNAVGGNVKRIRPYYEQLGLAVNLEDKPDDLISETLVLNSMNEDKLKFILDKMEKELQDFVNAHRIRLVDKSFNSLTFSPVVKRNEWKTRVEEAFNENILLRLHVEKLEIKEERKWRHLQEKKEELCGMTTTVNLYEDKRSSTFILVSRKSDETDLISLKEKIQSTEPPEESVNDIVDGYSSMKLRAFEALGFKHDVESETRVELKIHIDDGKIELTGLEKNNKEAKIEIVKKLGSLGENTCSPPNADYLEILKSPQMIEQSNREIEKNKLRGICGITSDGNSQTLVVCYEDNTKGTFKQIKDLIFGLLETYEIDIAGVVEKKSLAILGIEIGDIENFYQPFLKVKVLEDKKYVRITCRNDLMVECKQKVRNAIKHHLICTSEVPIEAAIACYMHDVMKSQIEKDLQEPCGKNPDWEFKNSKFYVTGNQNARSKCTEVLCRLASKVIATWRPIARKGIQKYFKSGAGKNMESDVTHCHLTILGKDEFQKQKIRAIALTKEGQVLCIGGMELYNLPMDGVVNVMNEDFEHFKKGGTEIERENADYITANRKLSEGKVFVTGSRKIVHAVAPKLLGETEIEDETLKKTIENILSSAESMSFRSIAMPMVACSTLFGYSERRASEILLQTVIKFCPKSIREIYICDKYSANIKQFKKLAEDRFALQCFSVPMGQNVTLGKFGQKPNKQLKAESHTVVQRRGIRIIPLPAGRKVIITWGDLARLSDCTPPLKADIIVNPSTTFPVLSGEVANSLKAAASTGGTFDLESECKKKEPQGGLPKGSHVATDTPHMPCDQILHLRVEGDWNKINDEILKSYIKSCMEYASSNNKRSIAFPTIGVGRLGYPKDVVARCFVHAIAEFSQAQMSGPLEDVIIVIYHLDTETTMAFEKELNDLLAKRPHRLVANIEEEIMKEKHVEEQKTGIRSGSSSSANPSPSSPIQLETYQLGNGGNLTLKYGSLEVSGAAALVSPTSAIPNLNGAIPSAIKNAAGGKPIEDELQLNYAKGVEVGDLAITRAGNIRGCNKVYHLKLEDFNSQKGSQAFLIYNSIKKCLDQADRDNVPSIAFPTIGTGGFKWPVQLVANETFQAVESYFNSRPSSRSPLHISIMIFSQKSPEDLVFQKTARNKFDQRGSPPNNSVGSSDNGQTATAAYSNMKIDLLYGKLEESKADVIVSTTSSFPNLNGDIAQTLSKVAGSSLQADCDKNYPNGIKDGEVASTVGGNLNCKKVFHIKLTEWDHGNGKSVVERAVTECLKMLQTAGFHSIVFPTVGTGKFNYPANDVASAMFESAKRFSGNNPGYHFHVTIVLFPPAKDVNQEFKDALSQTFQDVKEDVVGQKNRKRVHFADNDDDETGLEKRDFVLLKFISDSMDKTNKAFQSVITKVDKDFTGHEPLKNSVIVRLQDSDIQDIVMICSALDVEVEVSKENNEIYFNGTTGDVTKANTQVLEIIKTLHGALQNENVGKLVNRYFEWCYEEKKNILIPYSRKIGIGLEVAKTKGNNTYDFTDTDGLKYCVDFSKEEEFEVNKESNKVKVVRLDRKTGGLESLPAHWDQIDTNNLKVVTLQTTTKEYLDVKASFNSTLGNPRKIHEIKRIENGTVYHQYALERKRMQHENPNLPSVEMILWHGTTLDNVQKINLNGFVKGAADQTFDGKVWYGKGVYFSTQSEHECDDNYTKKDANGHKYMYQCRVLTGNSTVVDQDYKEKYPPTDKTTKKEFNSTSSAAKDIYVIYSDTGAYPEYLIEFE